MNLVDMARAMTPRHVCPRCGLSVRFTSGVWLDYSGSAGCWDNYPHGGEIWVAPSPLLQVRRNS